MTPCAIFFAKENPTEYMLFMRTWPHSLGGPMHMSTCGEEVSIWYSGPHLSPYLGWPTTVGPLSLSGSICIRWSKWSQIDWIGDMIVWPNNHWTSIKKKYCPVLGLEQKNLLSGHYAKVNFFGRTYVKIEKNFPKLKGFSKLFEGRATPAPLVLPLSCFVFTCSLHLFI